MDQNNLESNDLQESVFDKNYNAGFSEGDVFQDMPSIVNVINDNEQAVREEPQIIVNSEVNTAPIINEMATPIEIKMDPVVFPVLNEDMDLDYSNSVIDNNEANTLENSSEIELKPKNDLDIYDLIDLNQNILIDNPVTEKDESLEEPPKEVYEEVSIDYDLENENSKYSNVVNSEENASSATDYNSPINVEGAYEESFVIPTNEEEII